MLSDKDLILEVTLPPNVVGRFTLSSPARKSNNDSRLVNDISRHLLNGWGIPSPRLMKAVSRHDDPDNLHDELLTHWSQPPATPLLPTLSDSPPMEEEDNITPHHRQYLGTVKHYIDEDEDSNSLGAALLKTPNDVPNTQLNYEWFHLLGPDTDLLETATSNNGGIRHILRLALHSRLAALAVKAHLERYQALLRTSPPTAALIQSLSHVDGHWVQAAARSNMLYASMNIRWYSYRYTATQVSGFTCGPDVQPPAPNCTDFNAPLGNLDLFVTYLRKAAPDCKFRPFTIRSGYWCVEFIHEERYRRQLYDLWGQTSPSHGIHRPLKLQYFINKKAAGQACSFCGGPGHVAHNCTHHLQRSDSTEEQPTEIDMEESKASPPSSTSIQRPACRNCYSLSHATGSCFTPAESQQCKICNAKGHTTWRCPSYQSTWIPIQRPTTTQPVNQRPMAVIAQQKGLPFTYAAMASGAGRSSSQVAPLSPSAPLPPAPPTLPLSIPASSPLPEVAALMAQVKSLMDDLQLVKAELASARNAPIPAATVAASNSSKFDQLIETLLKRDADREAREEARAIEHSNVLKALLARQPLADNSAYHQQYQPLPQFHQPPYQTTPFYPAAMASAPFHPHINAMSDSAQINAYMYAHQQSLSNSQPSSSPSFTSSAAMSSSSPAQSFPQPPVSMEVHNSSGILNQMIGSAPNAIHATQYLYPAGSIPQHHTSNGSPIPPPHAVGADWQQSHSITHPPTYSNTASSPPSSQ
jgi:hypothetical protein